MPAFVEWLKKAGREWINDHASYLAAAVAYHAIFSLAPLLIVILAIVGLIYQGSAQQEFQEALQGLVGRDSAELIQHMLEGGKAASQSKLALMLGAGLTLVGSIGVFGQLQQAVNLIWQSPTRKQTIVRFLKRQLVLFLLVIGSSLLLIFSLGVSAIFSRWLGSIAFYVALPAWIVSGIQLGVSSLMIMVLFGLLFKFLPEPFVPWKNVWLPALVTMILFTLGKYALGLYLGRGTVGSVYGAAGSLAGLLVWIFYATQIFLFGVELVKVQEPHFSVQEISLNESHPIPHKRTSFIGFVVLIGLFFGLKQKMRSSEENKKDS